MTAMRQYMYVSEATQAMDTADLKQLLAESRSGNSEHGVTGVLFYVGNRFIQLIEGETQVIEQLVSNIKGDSRHKLFFTLRDTEVAARDFPEWSMGFRLYSTDEFAQEQGYFNIEDADILEELRRRNEALINIMKAIYDD